MNKILIVLKIALIFIICTTITFGQNNNPKIYKLQVSSIFVGGTSTISVIDALTQTITNSFSIPISGDKMELSKNQKRAFISSRVGSNSNNSPGLVMVDLEQGNFRGIFPGENVYKTKVSPDNILWVLLGDENKIFLLNPDTLSPIAIIDKDKVQRPTDIVFSPDGKKAYISQTTFKGLEAFPIIGIFDTNTLRLVDSISGLPSTSPVVQRPKELAISPDGQTLAIGTKNVVNIINTQSLQIVNKFQFSTFSNFDFVELQFFSDSNTLYIGENGGESIYIYSVLDKNFKKIFIISDLATSIQEIQITPDNKIIYIIDFRGRYILDGENNSKIISIRDGLLGNVAGAIAGDFTIGQAPLLQTILPSANQLLLPNQQYTIAWQTTVQPQSFSIASHMIELSTDGGTTFNAIPGAEQLKADAQSFIWQVPNINTTKAQIRVSTVDLGARRASSTTANFTISGNGNGGDTQPPTVNFNSPIGGEKFNSGDSLQINWTSSDNVGVTSQDLSLSTDGGSTFPITLATGLPGSTQSFMYQIPMSLQSDQTRLKLVVRDAAGNSTQAITANNFSIVLGADTIAPTVVISQPTPGQIAIAGQPIQVKWQSTDNRAVANQALLLSVNGGKTFTQIASFGATDSSFVFNSSNINQLDLTTPQAIVKITATDSTGNKGEANSLFSIAPAITNATYQAKVLTITGIGFMSNVNNNVRLFVNDKEVTLTPSGVSNTSFTIKANKKKLNIVKGNNTVKLVVDGVSSNSFSFQF